MRLDLDIALVRIAVRPWVTAFFDLGRCTLVHLVTPSACPSVDFTIGTTGFSHTCVMWKRPMHDNADVYTPPSHFTHCVSSHEAATIAYPFDLLILSQTKLNT